MLQAARRLLVFAVQNHRISKSYPIRVLSVQKAAKRFAIGRMDDDRFRRETRSRAQLRPEHNESESRYRKRGKYGDCDEGSGHKSSNPKSRK
jgi:hypothetical protein